MICYLYECKHHGESTCKGRGDGRCLELIARHQTAEAKGSARPTCSDAETFYLGTGNLEGTDVEMSWHMVGTADGDITAMFRTWKQAEEYLKFLKG